MNQQEYNGWTNYETWLVALWLTNDSGSDEYYHELVRNYDEIYDASKALQEDIEENSPITEESGLYADLMNAAISEVNFYEIAKSFMEDKPDDDDDDTEESDDE